MAQFSLALPFILQNEGGYLQDEDGETMYGILESEARSYGYQGPMAALPIETAALIYRTRFWGGLDAVESQPVATKCLDMRVNFGTGGGTLVIQRALNTFEGIDVAEDGGLGPATIAGINKVSPGALLEALADASGDRYRDIAARKPSKAKYLGGWLNRALRLPNFVKDNPASSALFVLLALVGLGFVAHGRRS